MVKRMSRKLNHFRDPLQNTVRTIPLAGRKAQRQGKEETVYCLDRSIHKVDYHHIEEYSHTTRELTS